MITRAVISFDVEKEGRWYHMLIPNGAPYKEAQEVMAECIAFIEKQQKEAIEKAAQEKTESAS